MSTLNQKIRILLANNGWSQAKLAEMLWVTPDAVSSWVRGINNPKIETIKKLSEIFYIPLQDLLNDDVDIPEYFEIDQYLPYSMCRYPENRRDQIHVIYDAALADEGYLHRFVDAAGCECSAIYRAGQEVWWHYREHEPRMIRDWNREYSK